MKFDEVVADIQKLVGKKIRSIRAGADIMLTEVNVVSGRLELLDSSDIHRSRSLIEIRRVWEQLCVQRAVHVDTVLGGSGSSRNQPETIFANLPYVEWLIIGGRKHLSYVGKPTHPLGELKKMDSLEAYALCEVGKKSNSAVPSVILITDDTRTFSDCLTEVSGCDPIATALGAYSHSFVDSDVLVVNVSTLAQPLPVGVYVTIPGKVPPLESRRVVIAEVNYHLLVHRGVNLLIHPG